MNEPPFTHENDMKTIRNLGLGIFCVCFSVTSAALAADDAKGPHPFSVADGQLKFSAVESWAPMKPGSNIVMSSGE